MLRILINRFDINNNKNYIIIHIQIQSVYNIDMTLLLVSYKIVN